MTCPPAPTRSGLSLLEVTIGMALMSIVLVGTTTAMHSGAAVTEASTEGSIASAEAGRIIHEIATSLRSADKNFIYDNTGVDTVIFTFTECTGFDPVTGAAEYDPATGSTTVTFDRSAGTLTKQVGGFTTKVADHVTNFVVDEDVDVADDTLHGKRVRLSLTITRDQGLPTETEITASRTVFLRAHLLDKDSFDAAANNDEEGTPAGGEEPSDYPADYPDEAIPADEETGADPPSIVWGTNTGPAGELILTVTVSPTGNNNRVYTDDVSVNFPHHWNDAYTITKNYVSSSKSTEISISGPLVGSTPITVSATAVDNRGDAQGTKTDTNYY